jgi:hypothetical protein
MDLLQFGLIEWDWLVFLDSWLGRMTPRVFGLCYSSVKFVGKFVA